MYDFRPQGALFSWVKKCRPEDRDWALAYLRRKGIVLNDAYESVGNDLIGSSDASDTLIAGQLRNAWRQRKARRKLVGRKAYNFVLSHSAKRKLDGIAETMFCSITDALNDFIDKEHRRIEVHDQALKALKKEDARLKNLSKSLENIKDVAQTLRETERALHLQTMKLVFARLQLDNRYAAHAPSDAFKEEVIERFHGAWQEVTIGMGLLALGLTIRVPDLEILWQKVISESPDNFQEASSTLS